MNKNITNTYLNTFQNYDDFGKESYNYIKGNDYVAFIIKDNIVIYWLNLEVIWRPLGITVTYTGEFLENGNNIVKVLLNGNNNIVYNYLPVIPDEDRIKNIEYFTSSYRYIENIKLDNTINLENINYAFRYLTINTFSLNVSKVITAKEAFRESIINCNILLDFKQVDVDDTNILYNTTCNNNCITINYNDNNYHIINNADEYKIYKLITNGNIELEAKANIFNTYIQSNKINLSLDAGNSGVGTNYIQNIIANEINATINYENPYNANINCKKLILKIVYNSRDFNYRISGIVEKELNIYTVNSNIFYGISLNKGSAISINDNTIINVLKDEETDENTLYIVPNFIFKLDTITDNFLKRINNITSLLQYKDNFQNYSNIYLEDITTKDLCYLYLTSNNNIPKTFNNSIIIKNGFVPTVNATINFNTFIVDTTEYAKDLEPEDYPIITSGNFPKILNGGHYGYYKIDNNNRYINLDNIKNANIYLSIDEIFIIYIDNEKYNNDNFNGEHIRFIPFESNSLNTMKIQIADGITKLKKLFDYDVKSFVYNNILNVSYLGSWYNNIIIFKYYNDIICYPTNILNYIRYIANAKEPLKVYSFKVVSCYYLKDTEYDNLDTIYLDFTDNTYMSINSSNLAVGESNDYFHNIININGNINCTLNLYNINYPYKVVNIDFNKINGDNINFLCFSSLNEESIKKIPNALEDNSSTEEEQKAIKIISVYRSQYNYWDTNDINAIISKNYEIAITEN